MPSFPAILAKHAESTAEQLGCSTNTLTSSEMVVLACSDFVVDNFRQYPAWWHNLRQQKPVSEEYHYYERWLNERVTDPQTETSIMRILRLFRREMLVRVAWMQWLNIATTEQSLQQLSHLAKVLINKAKVFAYDQCCREMGVPYGKNGQPQSLCILGMGKLGGDELNFSSDIDLIFTWPEHGVTRGADREFNNIQFFTRLGQLLICLIDKPTEDGIVYRVDMRLRPFGDSGALAVSFSALEDYYQEQGRDWERYAMIKAREIGQDNQENVVALYSLLRPFVYRRYIDFSVIQSLREMKMKITREVRRRLLKDNIKLGNGGIRECEFVVQALQLIRGGREKALQTSSFLSALAAIQQLHLLPESQVLQLRVGWLFLRRLENLLQSIADQQTQSLPTDALNRARLALGMGFENWASLSQALQQQMQAVNHVFNTVAGEAKSELESDARLIEAKICWQVEDSTVSTLSHFANLNADDLQQITLNLRHFKQDLLRRTLGPRARHALDVLMPRILVEIVENQQPALILSRLLPLIAGIASRSTYLELLTESSAALKQLIKLCASSSMITYHLTLYPMLLDELLDSASLYQVTELTAYRDELRQFMLRIPAAEPEQQHEALCQFKQIQILKITASDIAGTLPTMKVSDHLTWLAEAILAAVVQQAWLAVTVKYGKPEHLTTPAQHGLAIIGYGKLGGWELSYGSDLDLVFLHNAPAGSVTDGAKSIDSRQFYLKLAQRIIHLFSARTTAGSLYKVDARLRPSGAAGLLVSSLHAFLDYQLNEAWTWEHQALVRARLILGETELKQTFTTLRRQVLCQPRQKKQLQIEISHMRDKMRKHQVSKETASWDIKVDAGGIIDIEFIAQYFVLRFAHAHPMLTDWSDNIRIFEQLAELQLMTKQHASFLCCCYLLLRDKIHHLTLQALPARIAISEFADERAGVQGSFQHWLLNDVTDD